MTGQLPDDAVAPAALVIHRAHCGGSCRHEPREGSNDWVTARKALSAALPGLTGAITAQATTAERERIREMAVELEATVPQAIVNGAVLSTVRFADLLGGTADGAHTPGGDDA